MPATDRPLTRREPAYSIPAVLAIICAVASFFFGAGLGLLLAIAAILLGLVGVLLALSPGIRGGVLSVLSIVGGALGIVAAIVRLIF